MYDFFSIYYSLLKKDSLKSQKYLLKTFAKFGLSLYLLVMLYFYIYLKLVVIISSLTHANTSIWGSLRATTIIY